MPAPRSSRTARPPTSSPSIAGSTAPCCGLARHRPGTVDAYVVAIALDSDPVFGREARAAADVLQRRYNAAGRTIVLAGSDGSAPSALPRGSPGALAIVLARIAELMDRNEDALILYTTSHGTPFGLYYNDADNGFGAISPTRLRAMLDALGLGNRLLIVSACYSGVFVPVLRSPTSAIVTAASAERTSFGCAADNDWTFFGDAMVNRALRRPQPLAAAFVEAAGPGRRMGSPGPDHPLLAADRRRRPGAALARPARAAHAPRRDKPGRPPRDRDHPAHRRIALAPGLSATLRRALARPIPQLVHAEARRRGEGEGRSSETRIAPRLRVSARTSLPLLQQGRSWLSPG